MSPEVQQFLWTAFVSGVSATCGGLAVWMYMSDMLAVERVKRRSLDFQVEMYKRQRDTLLRVDRNKGAEG